MKSRYFRHFRSFRCFGDDETSCLQYGLSTSSQLAPTGKLYPNFRQAHFYHIYSLPSFLRHSKFLASFSSRQLSGPLSTPILISRIPPSADAAGPILPSARRKAYVRYVSYAASGTRRARARTHAHTHTGARGARAETRPLVITLKSTTRYVYTQIAETRGNLREYAVVTQKARNGSVFPGPGLFVLYVRSRAVLCILARRYLLSQEYLAR